MIALLPLYFSPGEPLGHDPALALKLVRRAAGALRAALTLCDGGGALAVALPKGADEPPARAARADIMLHTPDSAAPLRGLPPGTGVALTALRAAAGDLPAPHRTVLCLDPRAALASPAALAGAVRRLRSGVYELVVSAHAPTDHPCQARRSFGALHDFRLLGDGAQADLEDGCLTLRTPKPDGPGPFALELRPPGAILRLFPDTDEGEALRFTTPTDAPPPEHTRWRLLAARDTLPNPVLLPAVPRGAPWRWDGNLAQVVSTATGCALAGRQDFPELLESDGSFCVARLDGAWDGRDWPEHMGVAQQDADAALRITDALQLVRWRMRMRHGM